MDALWSILCLSLFYYKLRQLILAMRELTMSDMIASKSRTSTMFNISPRSRSNKSNTAHSPRFPPLSPGPTPKRASMHQAKSTPTKIIARASKLDDYKLSRKADHIHNKPNMPKISEINPRTTITASKPNMDRQITPYVNTPADSAMGSALGVGLGTAAMIPIPSKSMISTTSTLPSAVPSLDNTPAPSASHMSPSPSHPSDDETHTDVDEPVPNTSLVAVTTDSENKVIMDMSNIINEHRNTTDPGICTTDGTNTPVINPLKLSIDDKSTPSTTPMPIPPIPQNLNINSGLQRETKVRFSVFLENTSFPDSNDDEPTIEKDRSTITATYTQSCKDYVGSGLPSMLEEGDEYDGREEEDEDGNICIVYDDDDEDDEPITAITPKNKDDEHNDGNKNRDTEYSMAESKTNLTNLSVLEDPSTMRRHISDSAADEFTVATTTTTEV